jgi:hypothetical protein
MAAPQPGVLFCKVDGYQWPRDGLYGASSMTGP